MNTRWPGVRSRRNRRPPVIALLVLATTTAVAGPGDLDPTFGAGGRVILSIPDSGNLNAAQGGTAILQQPDGKLLVGREVYYWSSQEDFSVLRLNIDGSRDTTFGVDGRTSVALVGVSGIVRALLRQPDGKIVAAGDVGGSAAVPLSTTRASLVRYRADGSVDTSFGPVGIVQNDFSSTHASFASVVQQADGRLVAGGHVESASGARDMLLARFNADGSLDSTFGTSGRLIVDFAGAGAVDAVRSLALQADGKVVAQGYALDGSGAAKIAVLRVTSDGALDATFGQGGLTAIDVSAQTVAVGRAVHVLPDGKLVVSAQAPDSAAAATCSAIVARLDASGNLDSTFGTGSGLARIALGDCGAVAPNSASVEPGGEILVAYTLGGDAVVSRLTATGQLDTTFGSGGSAIVDLAVQDWWSNADPGFGVRLIRQSDGKMAVLASDAFDWMYGGAYFVVARLLPNGNSPGLISVRQPYHRVDEQSASATVDVRRTGGSTGTLSVDYAVTSETLTAGAIDGIDFASANGTLTWADGDTTDKQIEVRILDDAQADGWKHARVTLSNPTGGASFSSSRVFLQIEDNESAAPPARPSPPPATPPNSDRGGGAADLMLAFALALGLLSRRRAIRNA